MAAGLRILPVVQEGDGGGWTGVIAVAVVRGLDAGYRV